MIEREMTASWTDWQGMVVDGTFYLDRYLGGTERSAVYFTDWGEDNKPAAIKLIAADADAELHLSRWKLASELSHPNLLRIHQAGRCELDGVRLLYLVMEYADENLAEILRERPLSADEARDMTSGVLEALAALHYHGLVHGHLKPSNIMAIGDQLKISSDSIARAGSRAACQSAYDSPELAAQPLSSSSDIWSLGVTLVEALTQQPPESRGAAGQASVPELPAVLPAPFPEIAQHCLLSDPSRRWTISGIRAHLSRGQRPQGPGAEDHQASGQGQRVESGRQATAPEQNQPEAARAKVADAKNAEAIAKFIAASKIAPDAQSKLLEFRLPEWVAKRAVPEEAAAKQTPQRIWEGFKPYVPVTLAALVLASTAALFTAHSTRRGQGRTTLSSPVVSAARQPSARASAPTAARQPELNILSTAPASAVQASWVEAFSPGGASQPTAMSTSLSGALVPGAAIERPLPAVPWKARRTIHGRVKVKVKVAVDSSGSVQSATLDSRSPSRYFAGVAMETARRWRFSPAQMNGQNVASEWLLKFEFRRGRTEVHPTPLTAADRHL